MKCRPDTSECSKRPLTHPADTNPVNRETPSQSLARRPRAKRNPIPKKQIQNPETRTGYKFCALLATNSSFVVFFLFP